VTIGIQVGTFVMWLWIGGAIMALGILLALTPTRRRRPLARTGAVGRDQPRELAAAARERGLMINRHRIAGSR